MSRQTFAATLLLILVAATGLRTVWLRADPPQIDVVGVGIVWHDEGAWTHNARNRALWGTWETDQWNPVFVAPVFTALEYLSFREFGVGLWQARLVSAVSGIAAVAFLVAGLAAIANRRTALIGGALLATNYAFVMWNRAALMESTMTAFIVVAWAAYAIADRRPWWGALAGASVTLAWFTKAAAAFFVAAIVLDVATTLLLSRTARGRSGRPDWPAPGRDQTRAAAITLVSLAATALGIGLLFVLPHWTEYRFYNWQMSVLRKPEYDLRHFLDRATWVPIVQAIFMRMWLILATAALGILAILARWRSARPGERLLVWWVLIGLLELIVHDSGNDRRYVMFIPALVALAAVVLGRLTPVLPPGFASRAGRRAAAAPLLLFLGYIVFGAAIRPLFLDDIAASHFHRVVMAAAGLAIVATLLILGAWSRVTGWLATRAVTPTVGLAFLAIALGWNLVEFSRWAATHRDTNYQASVALGRLLPADTLVQGKLANGLALDNRIRPIFIGNHFGNYDDRLQRDDVRYILTYDLPSVGYESQADSGLIQELLDRYPQHHIVATFDVDETPAPDRAALIDKRPK